MKNKEYWRKSLTITGLLLFSWLMLTVLLGFYARESRELAHTPLALYAVLIGIYAWYLSKQDRTYGG